jgi:hypothetical protein
MKIKFNRVTWYSKLAAVIFFIAILPIWTFYIGAVYQEAVSLENQIVIDSARSLSQGETSQKLPKVTYQNSKFGWGLTLPSGWRLKENRNNGDVTIESYRSVSFDGYGAKQVVPAATINLSTIRVSRFTPVATKVGNVKYDAKKKALVDTGSTPTRCLPAYSAYGPNKDFPLFVFGGSMMSSPAYRDSAILLSDDNAIIINEVNYGISKSDASEIESLYRSLRLKEGVTALFPDCAKTSPQN